MKQIVSIIACMAWVFYAQVFAQDSTSTLKRNQLKMAWHHQVFLENPYHAIRQYHPFLNIGFEYTKSLTQHPRHAVGGFLHSTAVVYQPTSTDAYRYGDQHDRNIILTGVFHQYDMVSKERLQVNWRSGVVGRFGYGRVVTDQYVLVAGSGTTQVKLYEHAEKYYDAGVAFGPGVKYFLFDDFFIEANGVGTIMVYRWDKGAVADPNGSPRLAFSGLIGLGVRF